MVPDRESVVSMERSSVIKADVEGKSVLIRASVTASDDKKSHLKDLEEPLADGALVAGGAPNVWSFQYIGILCNYAAVGIIYGTFPRTVYPFLNNYLNMEGYQVIAATTLVTLPWSFKTFIGIISDSFPIMGYRRRPYMVFGWLMCLVFLIIMSVVPVHDPYYKFPDDSKLMETDLKLLQMHYPERFSFTAPASGAKYIILMMMASLGYVIADVAADAVLVSYAQRESEKERGSIQTLIYLTRSVFMAVSTAIVGFCMNGKSYAGDFDWSLEFNQVMLILCFAAAAVIPPTIFCVQEDKVVHKEFFTDRLGQMWKIIQQRAIWQIMAYKFFSGIFSGFGATPIYAVQKEWAGVKPLNESIFAIVGQIIFAFTLYMTKTYGLQWNWRRTIAITTVAVVVVDAAVAYMTIYDVFRSEWFWLGVPLLEELPFGIRFIVSTYICVEVADKGYEGATYGLLTTISNLSTPFASTLYKSIDSMFEVENTLVKFDSTRTRNQVAMVFGIMYIMKMLSLVWLVLLPPQKREAQELKRKGGSSKIAGALAIFIGLFALLWSLMTNLMSLFESTKCLRIAGGAGCK